ncbi:MAG TPA: hypothetical protein VJB60_02890 [Candidatus Peribacterales bacterium]|nr:hypothetical protein [Candidatus Peribacterales bacterium]
MGNQKSSFSNKKKNESGPNWQNRIGNPQRGEGNMNADRGEAQKMGDEQNRGYSSEASEDEEMDKKPVSASSSSRE